ncbi:hypothetical protein EHEL_090570 [Encephalitozoon hellem ATCC 50504]|uniref:FeS cluster assembly protein SufD n=1 Tax=Encephalitozoon hellem TaxID=27973 RepID=A0A9Q9C4F3_ENCHE|nr:uncharacterized protein EHEL_090570 [Encephalitozoon hellem ATCC 50504]AFM98952.1 hypothetical protein EHEL_090570 [Encephalitozoon hellem ATCC 50504]UTX43966.1 putative FeS cluster assembly protein SufD [Encephalitozoon hellem]WEL39451.1 putative FeS cluster assembly protein SufD [Encephalitozoon hellem]|eukprot:XP_003887933.1 hypothetical protein EHEL_090570 [Encephalitozoon hellem ATCC 50504]
MDLEICSFPAYTGGIFRSCIRWKKCGRASQRPSLLAARITGAVRIDGKEIKLLESTPVELRMEEGSETMYRCIIPRSAPPSMRLRSLEVVYTIIVEGYYGKKKNVRAEMFDVYPVGFEPSGKIESIIVHEDMIRIGDGDDTAFGEIVSSLRNKPASSGTIAEMVEQKRHVLEEFPRFMNKVVERYKKESKGDIYFYVSIEGDSGVEVGRHRVNAWNGDEEVAKIEYRRHLIESDVMTIWYKRNIRSTRIVLMVAECIDGKVSSSEERVVKEFNSNMCLYKRVPVNVKHDWFTFDCALFSVRFSYRIEFDGVGFVLPVNKVSPKARIGMDEYQQIILSNENRV